MENSATSKKNLHHDPQYFGVFANLARHNVYNILCEIADRTGLHQPATEEGLTKAQVIGILNPDLSNKDLQLKKINRPDTCKKVIDQLNRHFRFLPILNYTLDAGNPDSLVYFNVISRFIEQLESTRNQYTHAISTAKNFNGELIRCLEIIFDDGLPKIKERFQLEETDMNHLRRYKGFDKKKQRPKKNNDFKFNFFANNTITEKGLAFFICLFLEPAYSALFLKKLDGFKGGDTKAGRAVFDLYVIHRCLLPENKLQSTGNDKTAVLLDMLNELQRCPKELYDTLSPEDQEKFEITIPVEEMDETDGTKAILIRRKNRFPYFALRHIDHLQMFKKLRFQVDLGNYHFHSYDKEMDDQSIIRRWEKKLLSFGRLHEISERAKGKWKDLIRDPAQINDSTPAPFIMQTEAHYHFTDNNQFTNNNVALKDITNKFVELPELKTGKVEKTKSQEADYYLCTDELTGLLLYQYFVEKYKGPGAEDVIIKFKENTSSFLDSIISGKISPIEKEPVTEHASAAAIARLLNKTDFQKEYRERKDWLASILKPYKLEPHQVTDKICKYLMRLEPVDVNERAEKIIRFQIDETEKLLKRAGGPGSELDKKNKKLIRKQERNLHLSAGDSALFLAKDMLYLQPPLMIKDANGNELPKGKANPDEYQLLQARLAFFGREKSHLERTFGLCNLLDGENPHPFLHRINWMGCNDCLSFYIAYLEERKRFFEDLKIKKNISDFYFLTKNDRKRDKEYFINLAGVTKGKPINLPRGLFKDALIALLQQKGEPGMKKLVAGENIKHNIVYLINEWYKLHKDSHQPFYNYKRNYRTVDEWINDRPGDMKPLAKKYKTTGELTELAHRIKKSKEFKNKETGLLFYKAYSDKVIENEKLIRHFGACDQMLFMMCKEMLAREDDKIKDAFHNDNGFYLKDISPDNPKSILETRITFALPVYTSSRQIKYIEEEFKVKDYGKLRKYLKDRRLGGLLMYFDDDRIKLPVLQEQLKDYEKYRLLLFDSIYKFEKACGGSNEFKEVIEIEMKGAGEKHGYVRHATLVKKYAEMHNVSKNETDRLNIIRNAFSHNQFPSKDKMEGILKHEKPIIDEITQFALHLYSDFTNRLIKK